MTKLTFNHRFDWPKEFGAEQLQTLEQQLGVELPTDYREFLLAHNGGMPNRRFFSCVQDGEVVKEECYRFVCVDKHFLHPSEDAYWASVSFLYWGYEEHIPHDSLIIAKAGTENMILLRVKGKRRGQVDFKIIVTGVGDPDDDPEEATYPIAKSFSEFLGMLTDTYPPESE